MKPKDSLRMARKKEASRRKMIAAAVGLFTRHGLEAVTMEQIAEAADVARGTLYNHFPSRDAIAHAYLQQTFQDRSQDRIAQLQLLPDTRSRLVYIFTVLVEGVQRQKEIFEAFMIYRMKQVTSFRPPVEQAWTGLSLLIHEIIALGQRSGELRSDLDEGMLSGLFEYALIAATKPLYLQPARYDQFTSIQHSADLFLNGASR